MANTSDFEKVAVTANKVGPVVIIAAISLVAFGVVGLALWVVFQMLEHMPG